MAILSNGRSTECLACGYTALADTGPQLTVRQLCDALDSSPPELPLRFDFGGYPIDFDSEAGDYLSIRWITQRVAEQLSSPPLRTGEWAEKLRGVIGKTQQSLEANPDSHAWATPPQYPPGHGPAAEFKIAGVSVETDMVVVVVNDHEERFPICPACGFTGTLGPDHLTLGQLIDGLSGMREWAPVKFDLDRYITGTDIYGTDDTHLAITCQDDQPEPDQFTHVEGVLEHLHRVLNDQGYPNKNMRLYSPVWVRDEGAYDGGMVVGMKRVQPYVVLLTCHPEWGKW